MIKPHFQRFRLSENIQFGYDTIALCKNNDLSKLLIEQQVKITEQTFRQLDDAFRREQGSALSAQIAELDGRRDGLLVGIKLNVDSRTYHFDPVIRAAAQVVQKSIDKYGSKISGLNYQAETISIKSITDSWANDSHLAEAVDLLQIREWANELSIANEQFNKNYISRVEEQGSGPNTSTLQFRKFALESYRMLVANIEARATLDNTGIYVALIHQLNLLTAKYNLLVDARADNAQFMAKADKIDSNHGF